MCYPQRFRRFRHKMSSQPKKARRHYMEKSSSNKRNAITPNLKGFLCSCNFQEKQCVRESYNLLNSYVDKLNPKLVENEDEDKDDVDIEDALKQETSDLQETKLRPRLFQVMESGAKNFLFISTTLENPTELAEFIMKDIEASKQQQTRFLLRLIPVETTCKAFHDDLRKAFQPLAEKYFDCEPRTFSIMYNHRNNDCLNRDEITKLFAEMIFAVKAHHKVDLKAAEVSVVVEVIRSFAFIGVVPNYLKYKKYNLLALSGQNQTVKETTETVKEPA